MRSKPGVVGESHVLGEIGEVLNGKVAGRTGQHDITVYKSWALPPRIWPRPASSTSGRSAIGIGTTRAVLREQRELEISRSSATQLIDWIADYREKAHARRVSGPARRRAGRRSKRCLADGAAGRARALEAVMQRSRTMSSCRPARIGSIRASSATFPPTTRWPRCWATGQHRPRAARPQLAGESCADRARGGRARLVPADARTVFGWSGVIQDTASTRTLVALICARERASHTRQRAAACRASTRRWSCMPPVRVTARWRRPRCWPASAAPMCASFPWMSVSPCARTRWMRR